MAECNVDIVNPAAEIAWAAQPALATELFGTVINRVQQVTDNFTEFRINLNVGTVPGFAGAGLYGEYSILGTFADAVLLDGAGGTGGRTAIDVTGQFYSAWAPLDPLAIAAADVTLRIMGVGGDGIVNPTLGNISIEFR